MLTFRSTVSYLLLLALPYLVSCTDIETGEHPVNPLGMPRSILCGVLGGGWLLEGLDAARAKNFVRLIWGVAWTPKRAAERTVVMDIAPPRLTVAGRASTNVKGLKTVITIRPAN
ncbi:hypothetical protein BU17DRAFT_64104 [Hysterangium stoloniferum]|nr:hypothetical protein BU17DRAFT_64104 [Hysterangium stoloniferum]